MPIWQLIAAFIAVAFTVIGVGGLIRYSRPPMVVLVVSLLAIPIVGTAWYALRPGPTTDTRLVILLAYPPALIALALIVRMIWRLLPRRATLSTSAVEGSVSRMLLFWPCMVLAISDIVFLFEPAFAIANLGANALWFCAWIPARWRRLATESAFEIAAPPPRVYAFISEPSNWMRYTENLEAVTVHPEGPLAVGSEVVTRQPLEYRGFRGPRLLMPDSIEITSVITSLVPNRLISSRPLSLAMGDDTIELHATATGTNVATRVWRLMPYSHAVLGVRFEVLASKGERLGRARRGQERLRKLLEEPAAPVAFDSV